MGSLNEYAKLVRINTGSTSNQGFQAKITLPSSITLPGQGDYINFYCGLGTFECGLSAANKPESMQNGVIKWRWFANTPDGITHSSNFYSNGETVHILLAKDQNDYIVFRVNGVEVKRSAQKFSSYPNQTNPSRLILASCQSSPITNPLPAWRIQHNQVRAHEMQYKNSSAAWVNMTDSSKVLLEHWPTNITPPAPIDYTLDKSSVGNAEVYASIKF